MGQQSTAAEHLGCIRFVCDPVNERGVWVEVAGRTGPGRAVGVTRTSDEGLGFPLLPQSETMDDRDLEDWLRINYNILNPSEAILPALTESTPISISALRSVHIDQPRPLECEPPLAVNLTLIFLACTIGLPCIFSCIWTPVNP
jgi:hypothetical protein